MSKKNQSTRELLVEAIYDLGNDEFGSMDDVLELAKADEQQLVKMLIHIAEYYRDEYNS